MEPDRRYRGHRILRCHWAGDPRGGRWYIQSYHESGMQWADEDTRHHRTLADAREYINASEIAAGEAELTLWWAALDRMEAGSGWDDDTTEAIARAVGLIARPWGAEAPPKEPSAP